MRRPAEDLDTLPVERLPVERLIEAIEREAQLAKSLTWKRTLLKSATSLLERELFDDAANTHTCQRNGL